MPFFLPQFGNLSLERDYSDMILSTSSRRVAEIALTLPKLARSSRSDAGPEEQEASGYDPLARDGSKELKLNSVALLTPFVVSNLNFKSIYQPDITCCRKQSNTAMQPHCTKI